MKKIEIFLKNFLLRILLFFSNTSGIKNSNNQVEFSRVLFIRLNRIGDALVTTPLLHLIKEKINPKIYVLCDRKNKAAYQNNDDIDELLLFNKGIKGILEVLKFIKSNKIDCVVDLHDDVSTTVSFIVALAKTKHKFALEKDNKIIYTKTIPRLDSSKFHVVERLLEIAKLFNIKNIDYPNVRVRYNPKASSIEQAKSFIKSNFSENKFTIGINISAGSDARFWGIARFKELLVFLEQYNVNILILAAPNDLETAEIIANSSSENEKTKYKIFSSPDFDLFASIISQIDLLFTPDTMAVHLASVFNKKVFGIYVKYNTSDMIWSPYNTEFDCIITEESNLVNISYQQVIIRFKPFILKYLFANSN